MSARDDILANVRRSLGVTGREAPRRTAVEERLARAPEGLIPERAKVDGDERVAVFRAQAEASLATVTEIDDAAKVPEAVAEYLRLANLPARLRRGDDPRLAAMPWGDTLLDVSTGRSDGGDLVAVTHAFGAAAETGTVVTLSGPDNPTTLNFLPDYAILVVSARDIAGDYERVWGRLRERYGKGVMPRTVNWVTGPSRSGDIEQTLLLGAHGPRSVHVLIVRDDNS